MIESTHVIRNRSNHRENTETKEQYEDTMERERIKYNKRGGDSRSERKKQTTICVLVLSGLIILLICSLSICYSIIDLVDEISLVRNMNLFKNISTPLEGINQELEQLDMRLNHINVSSHLKIFQERFDQLEKMNVDKNLQGIYLELQGLQRYNISLYLSKLQQLQQNLQTDLQKELRYLGIWSERFNYELLYLKNEWNSNLLPLLKTINQTLFNFNDVFTSRVTDEITNEFSELTEFNEYNDLNNNINTDVKDNRAQTDTNIQDGPSINFNLNNGF